MTLLEKHFQEFSGLAAVTGHIFDDVQSTLDESAWLTDTITVYSFEDEIEE